MGDVTLTRDELDLTFHLGTNGDSIRVKEWYDRPGRNGYDRRLESVLFKDAEWSVVDVEDRAIENQPPTLSTPLSDQYATPLVPFELRIAEDVFSDVDQQGPLSLSVSLTDERPLPAWLQFDALARRFTGRPALTDTQSSSIVVTATDQKNASISDVFELNISSPSGSFVFGSRRSDILTGSAADDVFILDRGNDTLTGGDGNDTFVGLGSNLGVNIIYAGDGFDTIKAGFDDDVIQLRSFGPEHSVERIDGGTGYDILKGNNSPQTIDLSETRVVGIEKIDAGGGKDIVIGSSNPDIISGGAGNDTLFGADGDDRFLVRRSQGADVFNGGAGIDAIVGEDTDDRIGLRDFSGANSVEIIDGGGGFDTIHGTGASQTLDFSATSLIGINWIDGRSGRDVLIGSSSDDVIFGGAGHDQLSGGPGNDNLTGGGGNDHFTFARGHDTDVITDDKGSKDRLTISGASHDELWLWRQNDDLAIGLVDTTDRVVVRSWFSSSNPPIEITRTSDDSMRLVNSQVLQLVGAMSVFDPISQGHMNVPAPLIEETAPAIAEAWQPA